VQEKDGFSQFRSEENYRFGGKAAILGAT